MTRETNWTKLLLSITINIAIPALILTNLSSPESLGPAPALIVALAFPVTYGIYAFLKERKINLFSGLGFLNTVLTGGIGLLQINIFWVAVKEAAIPLAIGIVILISELMKRPITRSMTQTVLNEPAILQKITGKNQKSAYEKLLTNTNHILASAFFLSAILNYALARLLVISPAGSTAFNEEIGKMTALSYPVIVLPATIVMVIALYYLFSGITKLTGLKLEEVMKDPDDGKNTTSLNDSENTPV